MAAALAMNFCRHLESALANSNKGQVVGSRSDKVGKDWESALANSKKGQVAGSRSDKVGQDWESALANSKRGQVAQLVEQRTENPRVGGSIPPLATIFC